MHASFTSFSTKNIASEVVSRPEMTAGSILNVSGSKTCQFMDEKSKIETHQKDVKTVLKNRRSSVEYDNILIDYDF